MSYINSRQVQALSEDQIRTFAPSVFAVAAHESRSERFSPTSGRLVGRWREAAVLYGRFRVG